MKKASKIIVTIVAIIAFVFLSAVNNFVRKQAGFHTPGTLGTIIFAAFIGALIAVWEKPNGKGGNDSNIQKK